MISGDDECWPRVELNPGEAKAVDGEIKLGSLNSAMSKFNVLRWALPDSVKDLCPDGLKVLKFEKRDIVVVWFKNNILIYDHVNLSALQNGNDSCKAVVSLPSSLT